MSKQGFASPLHEYIEKWLDRNNSTWDAAVKAGVVAGGTGTRVSRGSVPRPETLVKLAEWMGVSKARLLILAGYIDQGDLIPGPDLQLDESQEEILDLWDQIPPGRRSLARELLEVAARTGSQ